MNSQPSPMPEAVSVPVPAPESVHQPIVLDEPDRMAVLNTISSIRRSIAGISGLRTYLQLDAGLQKLVLQSATELSERLAVITRAIRDSDTNTPIPASSFVDAMAVMPHTSRKVQGVDGNLSSTLDTLEAILETLLTSK